VRQVIHRFYQMGMPGLDPHLILTAPAVPDNFRRALAARVTGFLGKDAPPEEVVAAVRRIAAGERVIDSRLASRCTCAD
jgi:DNA-binding NarL/FixJ family response regulator